MSCVARWENLAVCFHETVVDDHVDTAKKYCLRPIARDNEYSKCYHFLTNIYFSQVSCSNIFYQHHTNTYKHKIVLITQQIN